MRTMTDAKNWGFLFTVTDLARFLGKSPVTLRHWERQGLITFPRDGSGDRKLTLEQMRNVAKIARAMSRITEQRLNYINAAITLLEVIEQENMK
jgi:DNA-binding transcriptional MerR regulator